MDSDFRILGELEILQDGDPVILGSPRQRALLARLLISPGEVVTTDRLLEDLWPGDAPETARRVLHVYVSRLRKALGGDRHRLEHRSPGYRFSIEPEELDVGRFEQYVAEGRAALARRDPDGARTRLVEALDEWRGPALAEFRDEAFAQEEVSRLEELRLSALQERLWAEVELGRHGELVEELKDLVSRHPFREVFWEQLMLALYRSGRQTEALRTYQMARSKLSEELGIEPGPALRQMEERILAQDPTLDPSGGNARQSRLSEIPEPRTSFVGRAQELAHVGELLAESRLLSFTGPPGSGKTRLAIQLVTDHQQRFAHGAYFVDLTAERNPRLVADAIARVLGLREVPGETALDRVKAFLRDRQVLLLLDNFEQVVPAAPQVGALLDAAPGLTVVVTSRECLGISGEQEFAVPPLNLPPVDELPQSESLAAYDAIALFLARARAVDSSFWLNAENAEAVAAITLRLDGIPLAIELAAARIKLFPPDVLNRRLQQRLAVLSGGPADAVDRHRTMRDAIAWSYELLDSADQALFRRLSVFAGGFSFDAVEAITGLSDSDVVNGIESLLSKSLILRQIEAGPARFSMLELVREFALDELGAAGEAADAAAEHAGFFLRICRELEPKLTRQPAGAAAQRLQSEIDNVRAALRFSLDTDEPDLGLELTRNIWRFWQSSEQIAEGRDWLSLLLSHPQASGPAMAKGLTADGGLAYWQADYPAAMDRYTQALELYRAAGDRFNEADTLYSMSLTSNWAGNLAAGERFADQARMIFDELGSIEGRGRALMAQGFSLWRRNELGAAQALWEQSLAIAREIGDEALANTQLVGLASLRFHQGHREEALRIVLGGVEEARKLQNAHVTVWMLDFVAAFVAPDAPVHAVRLAGAVDSLRRTAGGGILPVTLDVEDARTVASRLLSEATLEQEWTAGRAMDLEQAIELAVALDA